MIGNRIRVGNCGGLLELERRKGAGPQPRRLRRWRQVDMRPEAFDALRNLGKLAQCVVRKTPRAVWCRVGVPRSSVSTMADRHFIAPSEESVSHSYVRMAARSWAG